MSRGALTFPRERCRLSAGVMNVDTCQWLGVRLEVRKCGARMVWKRDSSLKIHPHVVQLVASADGDPATSFRAATGFARTTGQAGVGRVALRGVDAHTVRVRYEYWNHPGGAAAGETAFHEWTIGVHDSVHQGQWAAITYWRGFGANEHRQFMLTAVGLL